MSDQHELLVGAITLLYQLRRLHHATPDGACCECKNPHPCTTAQLVGAGSITDMLRTVATTHPDSPHATTEPDR